MQTDTPLFGFDVSVEDVWDEDGYDVIGEAFFVTLPHQCGSWLIAPEDERLYDLKYDNTNLRTREEALADLDSFIAEAQFIRNELEIRGRDYWKQ